MGDVFIQHWPLDPSINYLNHGSFGACPLAVMNFQTELRRELESEPVDFLVRRLPARLDEARRSLATFVKAEPANLVFVPNSTTGINAVLNSIDFAPGDECLTTSHVYAACRKSLDFFAGRNGTDVVVVDVPFPVGSGDQVVAAVLASVTPRTRLALLDHVTSPTALIYPIERLVRELSSRGVETLVDGAHAPGMVPLDLGSLGAAYYTGNAHKWLCAPKGAAFLFVQKNRQADLHPTVISHGYLEGFHAEFDWTGTCDPTAWLCIPESIRYLGSLLPGGWPELMTANHTLTLQARSLLCDAFDIPAPCPDSMIGAMASIPLPEPEPGSPVARLNREELSAWFRARGVETWFYPSPRPLLRVSAQLYNSLSQYKRLAELLEEALSGDGGSVAS
jgi:isopenicillin-N epimerase